MRLPRFNKNNIFYNAFIYISIIFIIIDSIQLAFYPFIFWGKLIEVRDIIESQLPKVISNLDMRIIFVVLIINVLIRIIAVVKILRNNKQGIYIGIVSCIYTIAIVVLILTKNAIWESIVMVALIVILLLGELKERKLTIASSL